MDDLFDYLKRCGGKDTLHFDSSEQASAARSLLLDQLEAEGVSFDNRPAIVQFNKALIVSLRDKLEVPLNEEVLAGHGG